MDATVPVGDAEPVAEFAVDVAGSVFEHAPRRTAAATSSMRDIMATFLFWAAGLVAARPALARTEPVETDWARPCLRLRGCIARAGNRAQGLDTIRRATRQASRRFIEFPESFGCLFGLQTKRSLCVAPQRLRPADPSSLTERVRRIASRSRPRRAASAAASTTRKERGDLVDVDGMRAVLWALRSVQGLRLVKRLQTTTAP